MIEYPEELLRGISCNNEQYITPEGYPTQAVFRFDEYNPERKDGFRELLDAIFFVRFSRHGLCPLFSSAREVARPPVVTGA